jgi:hypothetical protein
VTPQLSKEKRNEERFQNFAGCWPSAGSRYGCVAGCRTAGRGSAEGRVAGCDCSSQGNQNAVPNIVQQTKDTLLQTNLNYQKDLNEVAVIVAKNLAGREKEIGEGMAQIYANEFTEQELKDLVIFYKSPLGQKVFANEPRAIQSSMAYMNQWAQQFGEIVNGEFRAEMRKRGKQI